MQILSVTKDTPLLFLPTSVLQWIVAIILFSWLLMFALTACCLIHYKSNQKPTRKIHIYDTISIILVMMLCCITSVQHKLPWNNPVKYNYTYIVNFTDSNLCTKYLTKYDCTKIEDNMYSIYTTRELTTIP